MAGFWAPHPSPLAGGSHLLCCSPPSRFPNPRGKLLSPLIAAICFLLSITNRTSGPRVCILGGGVRMQLFLWTVGVGAGVHWDGAAKDSIQASFPRPEGPPAVWVPPVVTPHPTSKQHPCRAQLRATARVRPLAGAPDGPSLLGSASRN